MLFKLENLLIKNIAVVFFIISLFLHVSEALITAYQFINAQQVQSSMISAFANFIFLSIAAVQFITAQSLPRLFFDLVKDTKDIFTDLLYFVFMLGVYLFCIMFFVHINLIFDGVIYVDQYLPKFFYEFYSIDTAKITGWTDPTVNNFRVGAVAIFVIAMGFLFENIISIYSLKEYIAHRKEEIAKQTEEQKKKDNEKKLKEDKEKEEQRKKDEEERKKNEERGLVLFEGDQRKADMFNSLKRYLNMTAQQEGKLQVFVNHVFSRSDVGDSTNFAMLTSYIRALETAEEKKNKVTADRQADAFRVACDEYNKVVNNLIKELNEKIDNFNMPVVHNVINFTSYVKKLIDLIPSESFYSLFPTICKDRGDENKNKELALTEIIRRINEKTLRGTDLKKEICDLWESYDVSLKKKYLIEILEKIEADRSGLLMLRTKWIV